LFQPRKSQKKILEYIEKGGYMGVSAVPGSGKTHILSYLASELIHNINDDQEVLIVTLVNAAVDNFRNRIDTFIEQKGLLKGFGYRVCTLHSLAHEIVRERPSLVGLDSDFEIVDDYAATQLLSEVVDNWLSSNIEFVNTLLKPELRPHKVSQLYKNDIPYLLQSIAKSFIKRAKDYRLTPSNVADLYHQTEFDLPLAKMGLDIYHEYQYRLARTGVDFDDLIRLAAQTLTLDDDFLQRLRYKWSYILEDEAQDSSELQEHILRSLAGTNGNWVRVGDPNQAIYETFTTARPENLRKFLKEDNVWGLPMPESGRSTISIINLANYLITWTQEEHPESKVRAALEPPFIKPTSLNDPQPNPADKPHEIYFPEPQRHQFSPQREIELVTKSVDKWLKENPKKTAAILVPRNKKGANVTDALRQAHVEYVELLSSTASTRSTAGVLANILKHVAKPTDSKQLAKVFQVWKRNEWEDESLMHIFKEIKKTLQKLPHTETYLWPKPGFEMRFSEKSSFFDENSPTGEDEKIAYDMLIEFRNIVRVWHAASILQIDQLLLRLAQDLFERPADLALTHKFALMLRQTSREHPDWRLPQFIQELAEIAKNKRRFVGFDTEDTGFEPPPGKVTIATMHRAKGLEWDRVYLMGVNNYNFPSSQPQDSYFSEKWYIQDSLNLQAETLEQLELLRLPDHVYMPGEATLKGRIEVVKERLRLLYVGITRAKEELIVIWNTGRQIQGKLPNQPSLAWLALQNWWG